MDTRQPSQSPPPANWRAGQGITLYDYLAVIKRHIWWGIISFLVIYTIIFLYLFFWAKPIYRATAVVEVETSYPLLGPTGYLSFPKTETHLQMFKNQELLLKAMAELGSGTETISPLEREQRVRNFAKSLTLSIVAGTPLIQVNYEHEDPIQAAQIVNTIVKTYLAKLPKEKEQKSIARLAFMEEQLKQVGKRLNDTDTKLQEMKVSGKDTKKTEILANKLAQLELDTAKQSSGLGEKHPSLLALEEERSALQKQMAQLSSSDLSYLTTLREKIVNENLFNLLNTKIKEVQIEMADKTNPVSVVSYALVPGEPFKPDKKSIIICGGLISLLIGFCIILLCQALDISLDTPERIEEYLNLPVLVTIPRFTQYPSNVIHGIGAGSPNETEFIERLGRLATKIPLSGRRTTLAVISPTKETGKTTIVTHLGQSEAANGKKVILVDLDLRNPALHTRFSCLRTPGIIDVLSGDVPLEQVIQNISGMAGTDATLHIIPSGHRKGSILRLFNSPRLDELLVSLKDAYDLIIFDTAPILIAPEVLILLRKIESWILVHRARHLDRYIMGRFKSEFMPELKDKCKGIILNYAPHKEFDYYSSYYYKNS